MRSTRVPVHFSSPLLRSRPSNTFSSAVDFHSVLMSRRFTKKSLVSVSGRCVKTPCGDPPPVVRAQDAQAADKNRHLRRGQRQQLRLVDQKLLRWHDVSGLEVVAEAVHERLEVGEGRHVGLLPRRVRAAGREGNGHCAVEGFLHAREGFKNPGQLGGLVDVPILLRRETDARPVRPAALVGAPEGRRRSPGGPDELGDGKSRGEDPRLEIGDVLGVDQRVIDSGNRILPDRGLSASRFQAQPAACAGADRRGCSIAHRQGAQRTVSGA